MIDAPHETASQIVDEAAQRGWKIGQIVITHTHWDHVADAKALKEATGVPLAHPRTGAARQSAKNFGEPPVKIPQWRPTVRSTKEIRFRSARTPYRHARARA